EGVRATGQVMILLDTDHVSVLGFPTSAARESLTARMRDSSDTHFAIAIVTVEEQLRGWLLAVRQLARFSQGSRLAGRELAGMIEVSARPLPRIAAMNPLEHRRLLLTRRHFFGRSAAGIGTAALASLLNPKLFGDP